jgi:hypothetical protein
MLPPQSVSRLADHDMQSAPAALARSAQRARELAVRTGTPLIVTIDGKLTERMVSPAAANSLPRSSLSGHQN